MRLIEARLTQATDGHFTRARVATCRRKMATLVDRVLITAHRAHGINRSTRAASVSYGGASIAGDESGATMDGKDECLLRDLEQKLANGHGMIERLRLVDRTDGINKLIRKIQQEIKFLEKAR